MIWKLYRFHAILDGLFVGLFDLLTCWKLYLEMMVGGLQIMMDRFIDATYMLNSLIDCRSEFL